MTISIASIYINDRNTYDYDTHKTYDVVFFGDTIRTTVTHDPDTVEEWISDIDSYHPIVGLDVEWRPSFSPRRNPVATLQLCIGTRCLIFQILHAPYVLRELTKFFDDNVDAFDFVGVGVKSDLEKLLLDYGIGSGGSNAVELGKMAASVYDRSECKNMGLKDLTRFVLGKRVEKPRSVTMSRWDQQWLTDDQVMYACVDAYVSYEIARVLYDADNN